MKICISSNHQNIKLYFPTRLIFNTITAKFANTLGRRFANDSLKDISPEALELLCAELGNVKKKYGKWELLQIKSASGEIIEITL